MSDEKEQKFICRKKQVGICAVVNCYTVTQQKHIAYILILYTNIQIYTYICIYEYRRLSYAIYKTFDQQLKEQGF